MSRLIAFLIAFACVVALIILPRSILTALIAVIFFPCFLITLGHPRETYSPTEMDNANE